MKYLYNALLIVLIFLKATAASAQETILDDVSYPFMERLIETARENYPGVKAFDPRVKRAQYSIGRARFGWLSPFSISYVYQPSSTVNFIEPSFFSGVQFGILFQPGIYIQNFHAVKQAKEEVKIVEYEKEAYLLGIDAQVRSRYFIYIQKLAAVKLRTRALNNAQAVVADARLKYEKSEVTFDEYTKVLLSSYEQLQTKFISESELLVAKSNLEELLGKPLEEVK